MAEANTLCAGNATGLLDTLQPALIVRVTLSVVVAVPARAGAAISMPISESQMRRLARFNVLFRAIGITQSSLHPRICALSMKELLTVLCRIVAFRIAEVADT